MTHVFDRSLSGEALDQVFVEARTRFKYADTAVPEAVIRQVYDLAKMGPTSANNSPARFVFLGTSAAKERLKPHLMEANVAKTMAAPWCAIIAWDQKFFDKMDRLFPHNPGAREWFSSPEAALDNGMRNGSMQGAYLMMAARALGLACGPMSGFDKAGVDKEFFEGHPTMGEWRANWLCTLGYPDPSETLHDRLPRLSFDEACLTL